MRKNLLITSIIVILISSLVINVSAENLTELSTNDLFIKYPYYLNNAETNAITQRATVAYHSVMSEYDENDEFISVIKSGVSSSVEVIIRDIGSKLGLMDSYYETCMDTATIELMQTIYSDENLIAGMDVVKKSSELLEDVKTVSEITVVKTCEIAAALENLSENDVLAMTEELVENSGDIIDSVEDAANMAKYIYTACIITDVQLEMIDVLMERVVQNGELYEGLSRLRHKMSYNIVEYAGLTFIKNKGLAYISETVTKLGLNAFGISTGPFLIGQIIAKTAVWVMFDIIYPHPGADEVISNMIHSMYVMELETSLVNQRLAFNSPFYVSDMEAYKTVFNVYLAAIKTTLESTKVLAKNETAKQRLEIAKQNLENALPNYETYINICKKEVLSTSEVDRIMRPNDQTMYTSGTTIIGDPGELQNYKIIPVPSEGTTYWNMNVGGNLTVNTPVTFPMLTLNGTLDVNSDIIVDGDFSNSGTLKMEDDTDYVLVKGDYINYAHSNPTYITAGTLEIKGNINNGDRYRPTGTHRTVLSGNAQQNVYGGFYNILELANTSEVGISFESGVYVNKELYTNGGKLVNPSGIYLRGTAKLCSEWKNPISLYNWSTDEYVTFLDDVEIYGTGEYDKLGFNKNVTIHENVTFNDDIEIKGKLTLLGTLDVNADIIVDGDFINNGTLKMEDDADYVLVKGGYSYNGGYGKSDYITAGILEVKGNVSVHSNHYYPTGTHRTVLSGNARQEVRGKGYNLLEIANTSEEGISFENAVYVSKGIIQSTGARLLNRGKVQLQDKPAFVDYGELNAEINKFNGNAENVIPTWLDYERYCNFALDGDKAFTLNKSITGTKFDCDLYFSNDYDKSTATVIIAFYDGDNRLVQMKLKPVDVKAGKVDVSIDYESKPYSNYKIMVWESLGNLKPLMMVK